MIIELDRDMTFEEFETLCEVFQYKKALKYKRFKDAQLTLIANTLVKYMLYNKYGIELTKKQYSYSLHKKPYFENCRYYFNISHSGKYIVCVVDSSVVGVDIEEISSLNLKKINVNRFFTKTCNLSSKNNRLKHFIKSWTIIESIAKFYDISFLMLLYPACFTKYKDNFSTIKLINYYCEDKFNCTICTSINKSFNSIEVKKYSEYIKALKMSFNII